MGPLLFIFLLFWKVRSQEVTTPSSLLKPRNYNHHPFDAQQFLKDLNLAEPTKQGPVLFPNDAPPPPRPPLVVTSRPLVESIARSELANNTETSQSQINRVSFVPFLARVKDYRPYAPSPTFDYHFLPTQVPYADIVKKTRYNTLERDNRYNDYEEQTVLPPIYKALTEHAKYKVLEVPEKQNLYQTIQPGFADHPHNNDINEENAEYDQNQNYAFSYTVKDHNTGDDFSHSQQSSGSATNGEYRVRLPDGRMQIVSYTADENGYKADVRYDDDDKTAGNAIEERSNNYIPQNNYKNDYTANFKDNKYNFVTPSHNYDSKYKNFVTPTQQNYVPFNQDTDYSNRNNDYVDKSVNYDATDKKGNDKQERDYYSYPDVSKEYYNDYSSEYNANTEPHRSKFSFVDTKNVQVHKASTVTPSFEQLKDLFVTKSLYNTQQNYDDIKVTTTPITNDVTTERVVLIGNKTPNLYTNIKHSLPINVTPVPISYASPKVIVATTPRSYLVSTIASLRNKVHLATKPILSESFINRINKYINLK